MSDNDTPARSIALRTAGTGPRPIVRGSTPADAQPRIRARGVHPWAFAVSGSHTNNAAAPSLSVELLPAVTEPPLRNAGDNAASASSVVSGRGPSSRSTPLVLPFPAGTSTT